MSRSHSIVVGALGSALLIGGGVAAPVSHAVTARGHSVTSNNRCAKNQTKYLRADSAVDRHGAVRITGHHAYFFCDKNSEFIKTRKPNAAFRVRRGAPITVLSGKDENPDATHSVSARQFPHYLAHHQDENFYIFKGAALAIQSLSPGFQS